MQPVAFQLLAFSAQRAGCRRDLVVINWLRNARLGVVAPIAAEVSEPVDYALERVAGRSAPLEPDPYVSGDAKGGLFVFFQRRVPTLEERHFEVNLVKRLAPDVCIGKEENLGDVRKRKKRKEEKQKKNLTRESENLRQNIR